VQGVRCLTRIHTRSSEQVVDLGGDEVFNWPWLYAVEMGHSSFTDAQCAKLREYLLPGGFFIGFSQQALTNAAQRLCVPTPKTATKAVATFDDRSNGKSREG